MFDATNLHNTNKIKGVCIVGLLLTSEISFFPFVPLFLSSAGFELNFRENVGTAVTCWMYLFCTVTFIWTYRLMFTDWFTLYMEVDSTRHPMFRILLSVSGYSANIDGLYLIFLYNTLLFITPLFAQCLNYKFCTVLACAFGGFNVYLNNCEEGRHHLFYVLNISYAMVAYPLVGLHTAFVDRASIQYKEYTFVALLLLRNLLTHSVLVRLASISLVWISWILVAHVPQHEWLNCIGKKWYLFYLSFVFVLNTKNPPRYFLIPMSFLLFFIAETKRYLRLGLIALFVIGFAHLPTDNVAYNLPPPNYAPLLIPPTPPPLVD